MRRSACALLAQLVDVPCFRMRFMTVWPDASSYSRHDRCGPVPHLAARDTAKDAKRLQEHLHGHSWVQPAHHQDPLQPVFGPAPIPYKQGTPKGQIVRSSKW